MQNFHNFFVESIKPKSSKIHPIILNYPQYYHLKLTPPHPITSFDVDPTIRHSFFTLVCGGSIWWLNINGINQSMVQRYLSLRTVKKAQLSHALFTVGVIVMISLCIYNGFLLYAMFHDCDPLTTGLAKAKDQLLPLLAIETLKEFPGLTGVFVAGVFSAALSSASTGLNSMAAVILMDFCGKMKLSKFQTSLILRGTVVVLGVVAVLLVYVVERLGAVLQLAMTIPSAMGGPLLGVFVIGVLIPWIGGRAALWAAVVGSATMISIITKAQIETLSGNIRFPLKPVSTDGCRLVVLCTITTR
jgi:sodium-coupled monocarboxylate transporter 8/12